MVDKSRYLLGDANGQLLMLFVDMEEKIDGAAQVTSMKLEVLGNVSVPVLWLHVHVLYVEILLGREVALCACFVCLCCTCMYCVLVLCACVVCTVCLCCM